ncbi:MAG: sulfite exporter TauE/SafE family protein [Clostridia bacterium]|nr:sulfite exporter TauE/SafE family protein [Clostridia bacterium]
MKKYLKPVTIGFTTGILNGLFGAGGGSVLVPLMEKFLKIDEHKSHATAIPVILLMSAVSSFLYVKRGFFDFRIWLFVSIGGVVGGFWGAKFLKKVPKKWLKIGFGAIICVTAAKMIF